MELLVMVIGIFMTAMGISILLNPKMTKKMLAFWHKGKNIYLGGLIRVLLGIIFLSYAPLANSSGVMFALGILALLGGLFIFIMGAKRIKPILERLEKKPDSFLRLLSLIVLVCGVLILYAV